MGSKKCVSPNSNFNSQFACFPFVFQCFSFFFFDFSLFGFIFVCKKSLRAWAFSLCERLQVQVHSQDLGRAMKPVMTHAMCAWESEGDRSKISMAIVGGSLLPFLMYWSEMKQNQVWDIVALLENLFQAGEEKEGNYRFKPLSVSRWALFVALILRVFCLVRNPAELDSVTEIEGQTRSSEWCRGLSWV